MSEILNGTPGSPNLYSGKIWYLNFGYNVDKPTALAFTVIFSLLTIAHMYQAFKSKQRALLFTLATGSLIEMIGWITRVIAASSTEWRTYWGGFWFSNRNAYMAQMVCLIIAPAFLMAGAYLILGSVIRRLGLMYCRLPAKSYTIIFLTGDAISLTIQAVGGGIAASAETLDTANGGARIMVAGVMFQMVVMILYTLLLLDFAYRYGHDLPVRRIDPLAWTKKAKAKAAAFSPGERPVLDPKEERRARLMLVGLLGATVLIFVRSIYRTIELLDGWLGSIITNQLYFDVLDGGMIVLAVLLLNVLHPVFLLKNVPLSDTEERAGSGTEEIPEDEK